MTKIVLFVFLTLLSLRGLCQSPKSDVITAVMPPGSIALTKDEAAGFMKDNFKGHEIPLDDKTLDVENYYKMDGFIISFWDVSTNVDHKIKIEHLAAGIIGLFHRFNDTVNFQRIITFNSIKFFEYEYQIKGEIYIRFQSDANAKNQTVCGLIQCKKQDEIEAQNYLQELLQSMRFKE